MIDNSTAEEAVIMGSSPSKTLSKPCGGEERGAGELNTMAQRLFGSTALAEVVEVDDAGLPRVITVTFDSHTAAALLDPQRLRHAAWRLQNILDPSGNDPVSCAWDLDRLTVTVSAVTMPAPHAAPQ